MIWSRIASTRYEIGLASATALNQPVIVSRGKKADEKNSSAKNSGNVPCTASAEPGAQREHHPEAADGDRQEGRQHAAGSARPATPPSTRAPKITPDREEEERLHHRERPRRRRGGRRGSRCAATGEATRRSKKPPSMSSAKAAPALVPPIRMPCSIAPASAKSRKPRTGGKPGIVPGASPKEPVKIAIRTSGKKRLGTSACGRAQGADDRPARERRGLGDGEPHAGAGAAAAVSSAPRLQVAAGLGDEHVVERGHRQVELGGDHAGLVERAHHAGQRSRAAGEPHGERAAAVGRQRLAERPHSALGAGVVGRRVGQRDA